MKVCSCCGENKDLQEYHKDRRKSDGRVAQCKSCANNKAKNRWKKKSSDPAFKEKQSVRRRYWRYGLTEDSFKEKLVSQNNKCSICLELLEEPVVDHCHETGKVRGLLCRKCNAAIGLLKDDRTIIERASEYLRQWL